MLILHPTVCIYMEHTDTALMPQLSILSPTFSSPLQNIRTMMSVWMCVDVVNQSHEALICVHIRGHVTLVHRYTLIRALTAVSLSQHLWSGGRDTEKKRESTHMNKSVPWRRFMWNSRKPCVYSLSMLCSYTWAHLNVRNLNRHHTCVKTPTHPQGRLHF